MARSKAVANLSVSLTARTTAFAKGLNRARRQLGDFSAAVATTAGRVAKRAAVIGGALAGLAGGAGIVKSIKNLDNLVKTARKLKIPADRLLAIRDASEFAGIETAVVDKAMENLSRRLSEAGKGLGEAKDAFKELGIEAESLSRSRADKQFAMISDAFAGISNNSDRIRLAMKIFEESGASLLNVFEALSGGAGTGFAESVGKEMNAAQRHAERARKRMEEMIGRPISAPTFGRASAEIDRLAEAARKAGRVPSDEQGGKIEELTDKLKVIGDRLEGIFVQIAVQLGPSLVSIAESAANFLETVLAKMREFANTDLFAAITEFYSTLADLLVEAFSALNAHVDWSAVSSGLTQAFRVATEVLKDPRILFDFARNLALAIRSAIMSIPGVGETVGVVQGSRRMAIDNLSENLLTSANLTGSAARGLDAAGNAVGLGPIGTEMLTALRKIERNTADFVAGAVAQ